MRGLIAVVKEMMYANGVAHRTAPYSTDRALDLILAQPYDIQLADCEARQLVDIGPHAVTAMVDGEEQEQAEYIAAFPALHKVLNEIFERM